MTKNQLIKQLQKIKGNPEIICSSDAEGNSFNTLYQISPDLFYDEENRELRDEEDMLEPDTVTEGFKKCIVLWPS